MDEHTASQLCRLYAIGALVSPPEQVAGGLLHRMYRLRTAHGEYAVKVLHPNLVQEPDARERYRLSERIAAAVAAAHLPAVAALETAGDTIHDLGQATVMVYPWVDGQALSSASAGPDRARQIGGILGRIHALRLHFAALQPPPLRCYSDADWTLLVDEAHRKQTAWAQELRSALPEIAAWSRLSVEARQALQGTWVVSHSDLHQQNVLWSDEQTPWLIDWEAAGLEQPTKEALVAALEWSGLVAGAPDLAAFRAFLEAYRREAPLSSREAKHGLHACFGNWLGWLQFNMRRSLGAVTDDPEEQTLGVRQTTGTLVTMRRAESHLPALAKLCGE